MEALLRLVLNFAANPVELACLWTIIVCATVVTSTIAFDELTDY